ncbi:hypothetical protein AN958_04750 [Leucoagaricus sp. SymC.cos]|nr:hypothetical protein AN958_04750 [Leucoagaricus sp. SymC.cos]
MLPFDTPVPVKRKSQPMLSPLAGPSTPLDTFAPSDQLMADPFQFGSGLDPDLQQKINQSAGWDAASVTAMMTTAATVLPSATSASTSVHSQPSASPLAPHPHTPLPSQPLTAASQHVSTATTLSPVSATPATAVPTPASPSVSPQQAFINTHLMTYKIPVFPERYPKKDLASYEPVYRRLPSGDEVELLEVIRQEGLSADGVRYYPRIKSVLCERCGVIMIPKSLSNHLKNDRHKTKGQPRKGLDAQIGRFFTEVGLTEEDQPPEIDTLIGKPALQGLPVCLNALLCEVGGCQKVFTTRNAILQHHQASHHQVPLTQDWSWKTVCAQRYGGYRAPNGFRPPNVWFNVELSQELRAQLEPEEEDLLATSHDASSSTLSWLDNLYDDTQRVIAGNPLYRGDPREMSLWLSTVGWPHHVQEHPFSALRPLVAPPGKDEFPKLSDAVFGLMKEGLSKLTSTSVLILRMLNSRDPEISIKSKPFKRHQQGKKTLRQYSTEAAKLVAFLLRDRGDYCLPLPPRTQTLISTLRLLAASPTTPASELEEAIHRLLLDIWTHQWQPSDRNTLGDPTLCYICLASIQDNNVWAPPKNVTGIIARLTYCIRATFLLECHTGRRFPFRLTAAQLTDADIHPELQKIENNYNQLKQWQSINKECPFGSLANLQRVASSFAFAAISLPKVAWLDMQFSEFVYVGYRLSMDGLRDMAYELHRRTWRVFHDHVILGKTELLRLIPTQRISDDTTRLDAGFCFVEFDKKLARECGKALIMAISQDASLSQEFFHGNPRASKPILNDERFDRWLSWHSEFQQLVMACVEVMAGSPCRGTELTCLFLRNTAARPRGIYLFGNQVGIVCQYNKTSSLVGHEKMILHGADAITGDFLVQEAFLVRPFIAICERLRRPGDDEVVHNYSDYLFVKKGGIKFNTEDLTSTLKSVSATTLGYSFGVKDLRHILIGVRRVHCPEFEEAVSRGGGHRGTKKSSRGVGALQAGHSQETEDRLYAVSAKYSTGIADDMIPKFLTMSRKCQAMLGIPIAGVCKGEWISCSLVANREEYKRVAGVTAEALSHTLSHLSQVPLSIVPVATSAVNSSAPLPIQLPTQISTTKETISTPISPSTPARTAFSSNAPHHPVSPALISLSEHIHILPVELAEMDEDLRADLWEDSRMVLEKKRDDCNNEKTYDMRVKLMEDVLTCFELLC